MGGSELNGKNQERMEREKVITLLRLVKENGLKLDIAADEICSLFNISKSFYCKPFTEDGMMTDDEKCTKQCDDCKTDR
jgi:hypothetical protein